MAAAREEEGGRGPGDGHGMHMRLFRPVCWPDQARTADDPTELDKIEVDVVVVGGEALGSGQA